MSSQGTRDGGSGRRSAAERSSNAGATPRRVDRTRFVPLYFQIAEILKDRIEAQTWRPGDRFPSERELIEEFGVSRTVVRPALALLESDGQLVRIKGRGTFVAPPKTPLAVQGLVRLLSRPLQDGVTLRILAMTERRPEPYVRDVLGIRRGRVRNITALAARDGVPMFLGDSFSVVDALPWLGRSLAGLPTFDTADGPLGEVVLAPAAVQIETASLSHWEAEQLRAPPGASCYLVRCIEHAAPDTGGAPRAVELARVVYRSDKVRLELSAERD